MYSDISTLSVKGHFQVNKTERSYTQLDFRKQVKALQDGAATKCYSVYLTNLLNQVIKVLNDNIIEKSGSSTSKIMSQDLWCQRNTSFFMSERL